MYIAIGSGSTLGVLKKSATSNWPNETMKAKTAPATTPGAMIGSVTLRKAVSGLPVTLEYLGPNEGDVNHRGQA